MMPFWLLGHFTVRSSYVDFTTYHYLTSPEVRSLRQRRMLKYFLLPFVIFALVMTGIACLICLGLFFFASLKAQQRLYKMGQPPHANEFQDQQILLKEVDIK
jgi:hypothetical protein